MRARAASLLAACVAVASLAACQWVAGIGRHEYLDPPADAGVDASDADAGSACGARWPARPVTDDGQDHRTFVNVVRELGFTGTGFDGGLIGFDLDCVATCPGPESCAPHKGAQPHCDHAGGVDNGFADLAARIRSIASSYQLTDLQALVDRGTANFIIEVGDYNGSANDTSVQLAVYLSAGLAAANGDAGPEAGLPRPDWDAGTDSWSVDERSVLDGGHDTTYVPLYLVQDAYVADGMLVAQTGRFPFPLSQGGAYSVVDMQGVTLVGKIVAAGDTYRLDDAVVAGRFPTSGVLLALGRLRDPFTGGFYCDPGSVGLGFFRPLLCQAADIGGGGTGCDSLSVAIAFRTVPARRGALRTAADAGVACGDDAAVIEDCPADWAR